MPLFVFRYEGVGEITWREKYVEIDAPSVQAARDRARYMGPGTLLVPDHPAEREEDLALQRQIRQGARERLVVLERNIARGRMVERDHHDDK
ncbi:MAG TPA: hypothetical protein VJB95_02345 [Candidatus Paceibacterota bacterium]